ncbi:MAG: DUF3472 domain-containing protein [Elusimicrobia bacterium]|nr:DUF3472 domain-containing protein [Elusimicrobiota bacterium]
MLWLSAAMASVAVVCLIRPADAAPTESPRAARSVHLRWRAPDGELFYNELSVLESVPSTYFVAAGWNRGYFGIQEHGEKDMVLFSVWDPPRGDAPGSVASEDRVEILYGDPKAVIKRFGGEGTGAQCKYPYAWQAGETYRFLVRATVQGDTTAYTAWFYLNKTKQWKKLAVFRAPMEGSLLKGYYSFVEDFRRDGQSPRQQRRARFGPGWIRSATGKWEPVVKARFTADKTPLSNMNATTAGATFELATGGDVENTTKLDSILSIPKSRRGPPKDLPDEASQ